MELVITYQAAHSLGQARLTHLLPSVVPNGVPAAVLLQLDSLLMCPCMQVVGPHPARSHSPRYSIQGTAM